MKRTISGFTIVELLIVIVVIAILAAISIVAYNGVQSRANDSTITADLSNLSRQIHMYQAEHGTFPDSMATLNTYSRVSVSKSAYAITPDVEYNLLYCGPSSGDTFALAATSKSGKRFYVSSENSVREYTGSTAWSGGTSASAICASALPGSSSRGLVGYSAGAGDGPWRAWTN